jgi:hypothetical protein
MHARRTRIRQHACGTAAAAHQFAFVVLSFVLSLFFFRALVLFG